MNISELLIEGRNLLEAAHISDAKADTRKMLRHIIQAEGALLDLEAVLTEEQIAKARKMFGKRASHQPVSQILGYREFWGREFVVNSDTLDPRPDSELIIERVLTTVPARSILDLGTGTGCLLLTVLSEWPNSKGTGVDKSKAALKVASRNAKALGLDERAEFLQSDWFSNLIPPFDLILCNPPYISMSELEQLDPEVRDWEPHLALSPGKDGLSAYRSIAEDLPSYLASGGRGIFEIGHEQAEAVSEIFMKVGFLKIDVYQDINGKDRVVEVCKT